MIKNILIIFFLILILIQFIRPEKNISEQPHPQEIAQIYDVPQDVHFILKSVCYDCHSNHTDYPWYFNIQPLAWWLNSHIKEGKEHLNFSEFGTYSLKKQAHKLEEIAELVASKEMPLKSYTWMHKEAKLIPQEREIIINWAKEMQSRIEPGSQEEHNKEHHH